MFTPTPPIHVVTGGCFYAKKLADPSRFAAHNGGKNALCSALCEVLDADSTVVDCHAVRSSDIWSLHKDPVTKTYHIHLTKLRQKNGQVYFWHLTERYFHAGGTYTCPKGFVNHRKQSQCPEWNDVWRKRYEMYHRGFNVGDIVTLSKPLYMRLPNNTTFQPPVGTPFVVQKHSCPGTEKVSVISSDADGVIFSISKVFLD